MKAYRGICFEQACKERKLIQIAFFECNFHEIVLIVLIQLSRTSANDMERVSYCTFELFKVFKVLYEREVGRRGSNRANFKRKHLHFLACCSITQCILFDTIVENLCKHYCSSHMLWVCWHLIVLIKRGGIFNQHNELKLSSDQLSRQGRKIFQNAFVI